MAYTITEACKGCQACVRSCPTEAISGERHEIHSIDPQRCIECGTCGRICPYNAIHTPTGEIAERIRRSELLQPVIDQKTCVSCGICVTICPVSCLTLEYPEDQGGQDGYPYLSSAGISALQERFLCWQGKRLEIDAPFNHINRNYLSVGLLTDSNGSSKSQRHHEGKFCDNPVMIIPQRGSLFNEVICSL